MSLQHLIIVYIGREASVDNLNEAVHDLDWMVYNPVEMLEALGMYTFYYPDFVVIEDISTIAHEVYMHLRSIDAENILILTDAPQSWDVPLDSAIRVLPLDTTPQQLMMEIQSDTLIPG